MADTIERLYKLTVDGAQAARQLGDIARATDNLDKRMASAIDVVKKFTAALAVWSTTKQIVGGIGSIVEAFDQLGKDAQKVGVAAEQLQRLRYAADLSGVSGESLDKALTKLSVGMVGLATDTGGAAKALRAIGAKGGESAEETLGRIADKFASMPDGIEKTALAVALFGKAGAELIPMLNGGAAALKQLADEADRYGGVVSTATIAAAEQFNDNLSRLERTAAGAGAQLTAGLLPALQTLAQALVDATTQGDGFVSTGVSLGEILVSLGTYAIEVGARVQKLVLSLGALAAVIAAPSNQKMAIWKALGEDLDKIEKRTAETVARINASFKLFSDQQARSAANAKDNGAGLAAGLDAFVAAQLKVPTAVDPATEALKRQAEALKALTEQENRRMGVAKILVDLENEETRRNNERAESAERVKRENAAADKALADRIRALDPAGAAAEDFAAKLAEIDELFFSGAVKSGEQYDRMVAQLTGTFGKSTKAVEAHSEELEILTRGYEGFFSALGTGTVDASDAFRRMVQSVIADLLKLWAQKYILTFLMDAFGFKTTGAGGGFVEATGDAFDRGRVLPFAQGGVVSRPVRFPMGLMGEAGPEAILPLTRTASGNLGVHAQAPALNVTVNNYTPATVTTRRTGPDDLLVIVEQTRAAIASDLRSGGNVVSKSLEAAYGIGRGAAAPF